MLLEGTLGKMKDEHIRPLERSKSRLNQAITTINDILYISQLKLQEDMREVAEFNVVELFEELHNEYRVILRDKKLSYKLSYNPDRNIIVTGERKLLKLCISNLISNACKYTPEDGIIEVLIDNLEKSVSISIADSGIGIPKEEQDKIFNDFYRSTLSKKLGIEGTGLGLSIALEVIKKFNGKLKVISPSYLKMSEESLGTQFVIELPK
jgi:two-component system sensor histidine kinase VicK